MVGALVGPCPAPAMPGAHSARPTASAPRRCSAAAASLAGAVTPCSLQFDLEMGDALFSASSSTAQLAERLLSLSERLKHLLGAHDLTHSRLSRDVRYYKRLAMREEGRVDTVDLAASLASVGWRVSIRTAIGGGAGTACFQNLSHSFLVVAAAGSEGKDELIVEPNFREHFVIPHASELYSALLCLVPEEFVGTPCTLVPLAQLLCDEMRAAFAEQGLACPPWRQLKPVLSKWLPSRARDVPLPAPEAPAHAVPPRRCSEHCGGGGGSGRCGSGCASAPPRVGLRSPGRAAPRAGPRQRSLLSSGLSRGAAHAGAPVSAAQPSGAAAPAAAAAPAPHRAVCTTVRGWTSPRIARAGAGAQQ